MTTQGLTNDSVDVDFCTLGMFIIDEIHPSPTSPDQTIQNDIIGGGGTYSTLGARLLSPSPSLSKTVAWVVDAGHDFPQSVRTTIESWHTSVLLRPRDGPTTRGWNGYSGNETRAFRYLTEKKRITATDLTPRMLDSKSFHLVCGPERCVNEVRSLFAQRPSGNRAAPTVIWEPIPDLCTPSGLEAICAALTYVDVISPNHAELGNLFGFSHSDDGVIKQAVEEHAQRLLDRGIGKYGNGAVVVRAGAEGCFVLTRTVRKWLPAFHRDAQRVKDPTGGGNGFLGGFAVGFVRSGGDVVEAARWGSVAASYMIEQVGMPILGEALNNHGNEVWNGSSVVERLHEFQRSTT